MIAARNFRLLRLALLMAAHAFGRGLSGFRLLLACLILGVGAIAAVGAVSSGLSQGIENEGQMLLGGDIEARLTQRQMSRNQEEVFRSYGDVSVVAEMRSMATTDDEQTLIELKAVDDTYPFYGNVVLAPQMPLSLALTPDSEGVFGALADPILATRLGIEPGDSVKVGDATFILRAIIEREPDRISGGLTFGPRLMISEAALELTGLNQEGALINWLYRLRLPDNARTNANVDAIKLSLSDSFPQAGWRLRARDNAAPSVKRFIDRIALFLTLVGLSSLVLGGVGVGNAVRNHLEREREVIAIFKCLGATANDVTVLYVLQILMISTFGIIIGLILGALCPYLVEIMFGAQLPVPFVVRFNVLPLLLAGLYGFLISFAFALWPVSHAASVRPAGLFRAVVAPPLRYMSRFPKRSVTLSCIGALCLAGVMALFLAAERDFAAWFLSGLVASFILFWLLGRLIMRGARALRRPRSPILRLVVSNIHRPGAPTPFVVLSLGLGLTLFAAIALVDANFLLQVRRDLPENAPAFFFLDLRPAQQNEFNRILEESGIVDETQVVPMLRGYVTKLNDVPVNEMNIEGEGAWVVRGDRGLTYALAPPESTELVEGRWWSAEEADEPFLSFDAESARGLGLEVGDTVSVSVLGREITARIMNFRHIDWTNMGINFAMVFSPGALQNAPHTLLTTVAIREDLPSSQADALEDELRARVVKALPNVTVVRVKEALADVGRLIEQISLGVRLASIVTLFAGALVLMGAMAANFHARVYDSVILKVLGATRRRILAAYTIEYGLIGLATAIIAVILGAISARLIIVNVMEMGFVFLPIPVTSVVLLGVAFTIGFGLLGTFRALSAKPAPVLRNL